MKTFIPILLFFVISVRTFCCSCIGESSVRDALKDANSVFSGIVLSKKLIRIPDSSKFSRAFFKYEFLINQKYKGKFSIDTVIIYSGTGGGDCGYDFIIGQKYIVYGYKEDYLDKTSNLEGQNIFWTHICTRTIFFNEFEEKEIKNILNNLNQGIFRDKHIWNILQK